MREYERVDDRPVALEDLEAEAPLLYRRLDRDPFWHFFLETALDEAIRWTKDECRGVYLERANLYSLLVVQKESMSVVNQLE